MTFDYSAFETAENLDERLKILGKGLTAFFNDFPDAGKVPLEQAGRNSDYALRRKGLEFSLSRIEDEVLESPERLPDVDPLVNTHLTVQGQLVTLEDVDKQLVPHRQRHRQGTALFIFNHLATAEQPDLSHERLVRLIGKIDRGTGAVTFELPGFSPDKLSLEILKRMAQAHYFQATEWAAMLYPDPIQARDKATGHIAAVQMYGDNYLKLKIRNVERSIDALYQPACAAAARGVALAAMSATLGESGVSGDYYENRVKRLLDEAGTTLTDVFAGGATIGGAQLSPQECVTRFAIAINNLNQASRVRAASGLKNS